MKKKKRNQQRVRAAAEAYQRSKMKKANGPNSGPYAHIWFCEKTGTMHERRFRTQGGAQSSIAEAVAWGDSCPACDPQGARRKKAPPL